jgi:hypothetical protein
MFAQSISSARRTGQCTACDCGLHSMRAHYWLEPVSNPGQFFVSLVAVLYCILLFHMKSDSPAI